jgi:hypothetical protein
VTGVFSQVNQQNVNGYFTLTLVSGRFKKYTLALRNEMTTVLRFHLMFVSCLSGSFFARNTENGNIIIILSLSVPLYIPYPKTFSGFRLNLVLYVYTKIYWMN